LELFRRTTRRVELTPAGELLLADAREIVRRADEAVAKLAPSRAGSAGCFAWAFWATVRARRAPRSCAGSGRASLGVSLAAAILIDATIVRAVLLPASMKLLSRWNWYLPRWLEWLPRTSHGSAAVATAES
jgi:hypothetical protein